MLLKKLVILILVAFMSNLTFAQSQSINGLDEPSLVGRWTVLQITGDFPVNGYKPTIFEFNDGIELTRIDYMEFQTFFIGGSSTGYYTLHFVPNDIDQYFCNWVHYVIMEFDGQNLTLSNYKKTYQLHLKKEQASLNLVNSDSSTNMGKKYNVYGQEVEEPHGLYIQNGVKKIAN